MAIQQQQAQPIVIRFGSGINVQQSSLDIDPSESAGGFNFGLDINRKSFFRREVFDLAATTPNAGSILGFAQLVSTEGAISTLVQSGGNVYKWDGSTTFSLVGTCDSNSRLRGAFKANWPLTNQVIVTDLNLLTPVKIWDGTNFFTLPHNLSGPFYAKYCEVQDERAFYLNVFNGVALPHMIVGSERSDNTNLSVANRPSSSLGAADPFYLLSPDLRAVNGSAIILNSLAFSTRDAHVYLLNGTTAQDFSLVPLHDGSGSVSDEGFLYVGNDVAYTRAGKIESLFASLRQGDVDADDISRTIGPLIQEQKDWIACYNSRLQRVYFFCPELSSVFVYHKTFLDERMRSLANFRPSTDQSAWSLWQTDHALAYQPQCSMTLIDPVTQLETVFMGDASGHIYRLEGTGSQDGGTTDMRCERLSKAYDLPLEGEVFEISGWVVYRKIANITLTLSFEYQGYNLFDQSVTVTLTGPTFAPVYSGGYYYNNGSYYTSQFTRRLQRVPFTAAGRGTGVQVRATISGSSEFEIEEIGFKFTAT